MFVRAAHRTVTTSPGYADVLARRYRVDEPGLVRNIPTAHAPAAARAADTPTVAYVGGLTFGRGLEQTIAAVARLDGVRLRLVGPARAGFADGLLALAEEHGMADRLDICPPVRPREVPAAIADVQVGVALIQPVCLSYELTLPNKVFEYMAAGLPVLVSDLPVMRAFVEEHGLGAAAPPDRPAEIAAQIARLLEPRAKRGDPAAGARGGRKADVAPGTAGARRRLPRGPARVGHRAGVVSAAGSDDRSGRPDEEDIGALHEDLRAPSAGAWSGWSASSPRPMPSASDCSPCCRPWRGRGLGASGTETVQLARRLARRRRSTGATLADLAAAPGGQPRGAEHPPPPPSPPTTARPRPPTYSRELAARRRVLEHYASVAGDPASPPRTSRAGSAPSRTRSAARWRGCGRSASRSSCPG